MKQNELDVAPSDNEPSGSMEREDDLLKLGGGTQSDAKQSSLLESDNALLKQCSLEAGQPKVSRSTLESVPSDHMKKIALFKQKGKHFTGIIMYVQTRF